MKAFRPSKSLKLKVNKGEYQFEEEYNMKHKNRGKAIIFSQETFDNNYLKPRPESAIDVLHLTNVFQKFNFITETHLDFTANDIEKSLWKVAVDDDHSENDCLLIVVLTYGEPGILHAKDTHYNTDALWKPFAANICLSLAQKPKIFIIQACKVEKRVETDAATLKRIKIPNFADILVVYSSLSINVARSSPDPSCFIKYVCAEMLEYGANDHLLHLLTFVVRNVKTHLLASKIENFELQLPYITSTLTKLVKF